MRQRPTGRRTNASPTHYRGGVTVSTLLKEARSLRKRQTPAEELLWHLLRTKKLNGVKFRRQHQFGTMICDFYCHAAGLVIECDGAYHQEPDQSSRDRLRDALARENHLTVLRFMNEDILYHTQFVLETILAHITKAE